MVEFVLDCVEEQMFDRVDDVLKWLLTGLSTRWNIFTESVCRPIFCSKCLIMQTTSKKPLRTCLMVSDVVLHADVSIVQTGLSAASILRRFFSFRLYYAWGHRALLRRALSLHKGFCF